MSVGWAFVCSHALLLMVVDQLTHRAIDTLSNFMNSLIAIVDKFIQWEASLKTRLPGITILVELGLSQTDCEDIGAHIKELTIAIKPLKVIRVLHHHYPLTLAAFLTAEGTYFYKAPDYWSDVSSRTGIPHQICGIELGPAFLQVLNNLGLPTFPQLEFEGANKYVSKILAHGGIPNFSLNDFFERLLMRALTKPEWSNLSTPELIEEWRGQPAAFTSIDKPVRRFLFYGGRVAEDFFNRCKQMAQRAFEEGSVASADDLHLPSHIVEAFGAWFKVWSKGTHKPIGEKRLYHKPLITYEPWDRAIVVEFPAQALVYSEVTAMHWLATAGSVTRTIQPALRRRGNLLESEPKTYFIDQPAQSYEFSLVVNEAIARTWHFAGISKEQPLLAFESASGRWHNWREALPARVLWIIAPTTYQLTAKYQDADVPKPVSSQETFAPLGRAWSAYHGLQVDLTGAESLSIAAPHQAAVTVPLQHADEVTDSPSLYAGRELSLSLGRSEATRVYSGGLPGLRVPLGSSQNPADVLTRTVLLINRSRVVRLNQLLWEQIPDDNAIRIALGQPNCLNPDTVGEVQLDLIGALGQAATFNICALPFIRLTGHTVLLAPDSLGRSFPSRMQLTVPSTVAVESGQSEGIVLTATSPMASTSETAYSIESPPALTEARLTLVCGTLRLPLNIAIRRMRWALTGLSDDHAVIEWHSESIILSRDLITAAADPILMVDLSLLPGEQLSVQCKLYGGGPLLQEIDAPAQDGRARYLHFRLHAISDLLNQSTEGELSLALEGVLGNTLGYSQNIMALLVRLRQEFVVNNITLTVVTELNVRRAILNWAEAHHLRGRVVRLWPQWRPWAVPLQFDLPDDVQGQWEIPLLEQDLAPGLYRVEFAVIDPWAAPSPFSLPPQAGSLNTAETSIGDSIELNRYLDSLPAGPLRRLESALAFNAETELAALTEEYSAEHAAPLLEALLAFAAQGADGQYQISPASFAALGDTLLQYPAAFLEAIVARAPRGDDDRLRHLLVRLNLAVRPIDWPIAAYGLSLTDRERLWELWPPLGLCVDVRLLRLEDEEAQRRATRHLGRESETLIQPNSPISPDVFGKHIDAWLIERKLDQLRKFAREYSIMPQSRLDVDAWVLANLEWVDWMKSHKDREQRLVQWLRQILPIGRKTLTALASSQPALADVIKLLAARQGDDGPGLLCNVPYISGVLALVSRLAARDWNAVDADNRNDWNKAANFLYTFAPTLLVRDLCLSELLLLARWLGPTNVTA